ncbi:glycosyltransferase [Candidatus Woesearchaeota archaeon]|nr:glycosyltransferase [Candidatus Woesearchaeota archaeon]
MSNRGETVNIAIFTNSYLPFSGGVPTSIKTFKNAAEKLGHTVIVFAPSYPGHKSNGKGVIRIPSVKAMTYAGFYLPVPFSTEITKAFRRYDFDIVHVQHPYLLGETGMKMARKYNIPLVFTYHTMYEQYLHYLPVAESIANPVMRKFTTSFCNHSDLVIAPSEHVKEFLSKRNIETSIKVVPTGIELRPYRKKFRKGSIKRKHRIPQASKLLIYAGRITPEKNLKFLVKCMAKIAKKDPDVMCMLIGKSAEKDHYEYDLKDIVKREGMEDRIMFIGDVPHDKLIDYYKEADLFLFASKTETQGLVILEAMAAGTPVIAVDAPAISEFINGKNGFTVPQNMLKFTAKALSMLRDKKRMKQMSSNALKTAKKHSAENMAKKLIAEFRKVKPTQDEYENMRSLKDLSEIDWSDVIKKIMR